MHCQALIEATNEYLKEKGTEIVIETRGHHGLNPDWVPPEILRNGWVEGTKPTKKAKIELIAYEIGKRTKELADNLKQQKSRSGISQFATRSDTDSDTEASLLPERDKKSVERTYQVLSSYPYSNITIAQAKDRAWIQLKLYDLNSYTVLFKAPTKKPLDTFKILYRQLGRLGASIASGSASASSTFSSMVTSLSEKLLLDVLQNDCPEPIKNLFNKITLSADGKLVLRSDIATAVSVASAITPPHGSSAKEDSESIISTDLAAHPPLYSSKVKKSRKRKEADTTTTASADDTTVSPLLLSGGPQEGFHAKKTRTKKEEKPKVSSTRLSTHD